MLKANDSSDPQCSRVGLNNLAISHNVLRFVEEYIHTGTSHFIYPVNKDEQEYYEHYRLQTEYIKRDLYIRCFPSFIKLFSPYCGVLSNVD